VAAGILHTLENCIINVFVVYQRSFGLNQLILLCNQNPECRVSTSLLPKNKTPFEKWYGKKPDCSNFRAWGYKCCAWVEDKKRDALDENAIECILLGITGGGYRLMNLNS